MRSIPLLLATCLCFPACRQSPPISPPTLDRRAAAERVVGRLAGIRAVRGEVEVSFRHGDEERSVSGALVLEVPDRIRMRCWGPLGVTVLDLLVSGRTATLHMVRDGRAVRVDLDALRERGDGVEPELRALLLIDSVLADLETAEADWRLAREAPTVDRDAIVLLEGGVPAARITFDRSTLLPVSRTSLRGDPVEIRYEDYEEMDGVWWPSTMVVTSGDLTLEAEVDGLELNPELDERVFELTLPDGVEIDAR